jgi:hypothetical protein
VSARRASTHVLAKLLAASALSFAGVAVPLVARAQTEPGEFKPGPGGAASGSTAPAGAPPAAAPDPADPANPKPDPYAEPPAAAPPKPKKPTVGPKPEDDPLAVPEGIKGTIGSSYYHEDRPDGADRKRVGLWPLAYKERIGNEISTTVFPFYYDRRLFDAQQNKIEQESFYGLYYRKRSKKSDVDAAFPLFFRWRDDATTTTVVPPVLWRSAPNGEWHRWVAPLVFASSQPDGGYFHAPLLLTFSHHNPKRAFSLIGGIGFYDRTDKDKDWGVVPFYFGGSNYDKATSYFLIPPLLTYHSSDTENGKQTTLVGPVLYKSAPKSVVLDVFPLFLHNQDEDSRSTTFLPLFHSSANEKTGKSLFVTPLFLTATDPWENDNEGRRYRGRTIVTPLYSRYRGRTSLDLAGPIVPIFMHYEDPDIYKESWLIGPVYTSHDPTGYSLLTPLFGHWREYGVSRSTWIFPTFHHTTTTDGWSFNIHPLLYVGREGATAHNVLAPIYWDFLGAKKRTTIAFPVFWRFRDEEGITQLALNTLYLERPSSKGPNWDFYFLPIVHVGEAPNGGSWDVLFGLVGYKREGSYKQLKLFWIPIDLTKPPAAAPTRPAAPSPPPPPPP